MSKRSRARRRAQQRTAAAAALRQLGAMQAARRGYEAAQATDWRPLRGSNESGDAAIAAAGPRLRQSARYAEENDGYAVAVLDDLVDKTVGAGRTPQPVTRRRDGQLASDLNEQLAAEWERFWRNPDTTGELPGSEAERLIARSLYRDGECFVGHVFGAPRTELPHSRGYLIEPLEGDFVPYDLLATTPAATVVHGVELNRWRRPVAYHVHTGHPGSYQLAGYAWDTRRVPAELMTHVKFRRRLHQVRGVSVLHAALTTLHDVREGLESERVAMQIAASMTAYIRRSGEYQNLSQLADDIGDSSIGARGFELAPGMVWENLLPGEEVGTIGTDRPNQNLPIFVQSLMRIVSGATGTSCSSISGDYNGTYSAQRQEMVESAVAYRRLFAYLYGALYRPIWHRFVDAAVLAGTVRVPAGVERSTLYHFELSPPALPWIDPLKEMKAYREALEGKLMSWRQAVAELGRDPRQVQELIREEAATLAELRGDMGPAPAAGAGDDDGDAADSEPARLATAGGLR